jgi:hypothetical protein
MLAHRTEQRYIGVLACALGALGAVLPAASCGGPGFVAPLAHAPETPTGDQTRCRLAANQESPLVTEWPATEKANLRRACGKGR